MSEGVRRRRRRKLGAALLFSVSVHGGFCALLVWRAVRGVAPVSFAGEQSADFRVPGSLLSTDNGVPESALVELAMASEVLPPEPELVPRNLPEHEVDQGSEVVAQSSPALADGPVPSRPAPDQGNAKGSARPVVAVRADPTTSRQQMTDGASVYRASRSKTGWHLASPEPERREEVTGTGEVIVAAQSALALARVPESPADEAGSRAQEGDAVADRRAAALVTGQGPLQTKEGPQRFDTDVKGPAVDEVNTRSASDARNPQPLETVAVAAVGSAPSAHSGPGDSPGVVARPSAGSALAQHGSLVPAPSGPSVAVNAAQARRAGFERAIQERARKAMVFPRRMALMLEQGETIVRFVVGRDGQISGPVEVIRSAGFPEFDAEAEAAARRAAPYPRMPEPLTINLQFVFSNPMVR